MVLLLQQLNLLFEFSDDRFLLLQLGQVLLLVGYLLLIQVLVVVMLGFLSTEALGPWSGLIALHLPKLDSE